MRQASTWGHQKSSKLRFFFLRLWKYWLQRLGGEDLCKNHMLMQNLKLRLLPKLSLSKNYQEGCREHKKKTCHTTSTCCYLPFKKCLSQKTYCQNINKPFESSTVKNIYLWGQLCHNLPYSCVSGTYGGYTHTWPPHVWRLSVIKHRAPWSP